MRYFKMLMRFSSSEGYLKLMKVSLGNQSHRFLCLRKGRLLLNVHLKSVQFFAKKRLSFSFFRRLEKENIVSLLRTITGMEPGTGRMKIKTWMERNSNGNKNWKGARMGTKISKAWEQDQEWEWKREWTGWEWNRNGNGKKQNWIGNRIGIRIGKGWEKERECW